MTKIIILLVAVSVLIFSSPVQAQGLQGAGENLDKALGSSGLEKELTTSVGTVIQAVLSLVGTIFFILTIYAGILWMTAQGKDEQVTKAKDIIRAAIIGLAVVLAAYAITYFVTNKLGGASDPGNGINVTTTPDNT
ncbi:MAG TPA: hypothetical protein VJH75_01030 [Patescibacteria group bacterium]|nr:hypothetical protein [Patescibacteria group bacterium]